MVINKTVSTYKDCFTLCLFIFTGIWGGRFGAGYSSLTGCPGHGGYPGPGQTQCGHLRLSVLQLLPQQTPV